MLHGQLTELFMGEVHDYRIRTIIKRPGAVSTENLSCDFEEVGRPRTRTVADRVTNRGR